MTVEQKIIEKSFMSSLHPKVKIIIALFFSILVAMADSFYVLGQALALGIILVLISRIELNDLFKRLLPVNMVVLFLWLILPFSVKGQVVAQLGSLEISREGVLYALGITIKSNAMMMVLISIVCTTSIYSIGNAMQQLRCPVKLVHLFFFTYRYIHVIYREYKRLSNAAKVRGFTPGTNLTTYRTYAYMVGMLLVKSHERSQRVYKAMLCRGFAGEFHSLGTFVFKRLDLAVLSVMILLFISMGMIEWINLKY